MTIGVQVVVDRERPPTGQQGPPTWITMTDLVIEQAELFAHEAAQHVPST